MARGASQAGGTKKKVVGIVGFIVIAMISLLMFSNDVVSDPSGFTDDFYEEFIIEQNENDDNYDYEYDENDGYEGYINGLPMDEVGDI